MAGERGAGGAISWRCVVGLFRGSWGLATQGRKEGGREGGVEGPNEKQSRHNSLGFNIALFFIPEWFCLLLISCFCALLIQPGW